MEIPRERVVRSKKFLQIRAQRKILDNIGFFLISGVRQRVPWQVLAPGRKIRKKSKLSKILR
jgi:hypothetical protein